MIIHISQIDVIIIIHYDYPYTVYSDQQYQAFPLFFKDKKQVYITKPQ